MTEALVMALRDSSQEVREAGRSGVVGIASRCKDWFTIAPKLLKLTDSKCAETRCVALMTLHDVLRCASENVDLSVEHERIDSDLPRHLTSSLSPRLMDTDGYVRIAASQTIGSFCAVYGKSCELAELLAIVAAEDDDEDVRASALRALAAAAEAGDLKAEEVAVGATKDQSTEIRRQGLALLCALSQSGEEEISAVSAVCALISDPNDEIRRLAIQALPQMIRQDSTGVLAVRTLGSMARSRSRGGRRGQDQMAVCALESIASIAQRGPKSRASALSPVAACLKDENWIVREAAENAACLMNMTLSNTLNGFHPSFVHRIIRSSSSTSSSSSKDTFRSPSRSRSRSWKRSAFH